MDIPLLVMEVFVDDEGIMHEVLGSSGLRPGHVSTRCLQSLRTRADHEPQYARLVTCLGCAVPKSYTMRCQFCGVATGITMYAWAVEDVCEACAPPQEG